MKEIFVKLNIEIGEKYGVILAERDKKFNNFVKNCEKERLKFARILDTFVLLEFAREYVPAYKRKYLFTDIGNKLIKKTKPKESETSIEWLSRLTNDEFIRLIINTDEQFRKEFLGIDSIRGFSPLYEKIITDPRLTLKDVYLNNNN